MHFANTDLLREAALRFLEKGAYTDAPRGTRDYYQYWEEEDRRCREGYSVAGLRITGDHYFYLNYVPILRLSDEQMISGKGGVEKETGFPAFLDSDYDFYWCLEIARYGIDEDAYRKLDLNVKLPYLGGGKHLVVLKSRGKGYSYKGGGLLARRYAQERRQKCFAFAEDGGEYLLKDGLLTKAFDTIDHIDHHTAWRSPRLKSSQYHMRAGYTKKGPTGYVAAGRLNDVIGVSLKDDPDKARGKRGIIGIYEEAGKFPSLLKAWGISRPLYEQGAYTTGIMLAFGTGGSDDSDFHSLQQLFDHPDSYNCLPVIIPEDPHQYQRGLFVGADMNFEGFMDHDGNSDREAAAKHFLAHREVLKASGDPSSLTQYVAEFPLNPEEAMLQSTQNLFPVALIQQHVKEIRLTGRMNALLNGRLQEREDGGVKFVLDPFTHPPLLRWPHQKKEDTHGCVQILESPVLVNGEVPHGLYTIGHDPYASDVSEGGSLGSTYVIKNANPHSQGLSESIVAWWNGRPPTLDEYNRQLFLLAKYYNAKITFENNRGDVLPYAKRMRAMQWLQPELEMWHNTNLRSKASRGYGMHMTEGRKKVGEVYIRDWLLEPVSINENEEPIPRLFHILDTALLDELINYNAKGNFDRVMGLMIAMFSMKELAGKVLAPRTRTEDETEFFSRALFA